MPIYDMRYSAPIPSFPTPERKAWECPRCQRMNAPHTDHCDCSGESVSIPFQSPLPPMPPTPPIPTPYPWWHEPFGTGKNPLDPPYAITVTTTDNPPIYTKGLTS